MNFKKLITVFIVSAAAVLMMSAVSFAEVSVSDDGKSLSGLGIVFDDFEYDYIKEETKAAHYPDNYQSDVIHRGDGANNETLYLAPGEGVDGSMALRVKSSNNYIPDIRTREITDFASVNKTAVVSYDFRIHTNPATTYDSKNKRFTIAIGYFYVDANQLLMIQMDGENKFYFTQYDNRNRLYYELDKWYTAQVVQTPTKRIAYIMDKSTGEQLLKSEKDAAPFPETKKQYFSIFSLQTGVANSFTVYIDNVELNMFETDTTEVNVVKASVKNNAVDVSRNEPVKITFDKSVNSSNVKLTDEYGTEFSGYRIENAGMYAMNIVPEKALDKNKTYIIDLSSLGEDNIRFTTGAEYIIDAELKKTVLGEDNKSITVTYSLKDSQYVKKVSLRVMAVLYENSYMTDAALVTLTDKYITENIESTFNFTKEITKDSKIKLSFFDSGTWMPLSDGLLCN